jgi:hypothetical protein
VRDTLPLALIGIAIAAVGAYFLYRNRGKAHWPPVPATVVEVTIEQRAPDLNSRRDTVHYHTVLHYKYVTDGRLYRGRRHLGGPVTSRANAVDLGRGYASGQPIQVFVDERNPERSTLYPGEHRMQWFVIAFGLGLLVLALRPSFQ